MNLKNDKLFILLISAFSFVLGCRHLSKDISSTPPPPYIWNVGMEFLHDRKSFYEGTDTTYLKWLDELPEYRFIEENLRGCIQMYFSGIEVVVSDVEIVCAPNDSSRETYTRIERVSHPNEISPIDTFSIHFSRSEQSLNSRTLMEKYSGSYIVLKFPCSIHVKMDDKSSALVPLIRQQLQIRIRIGPDKVSVQEFNLK